LPRYTWPLLVIGARALSDGTLLRRVHPARTFAARLEKCASLLPVRTPVERAQQAAFSASLSSSGWDAAARAWEVAGQPYPLAWALLHAAEEAVVVRDRTAATDHLRQCVSVATRLSAAPLLRQAEALAKRARLPLTDTSLPAPPADPLGLTPRERA